MSLVQDACERGEPFHVILLDWRMPGLETAEVVRRIRRTAGEQVPLLVLTSCDFEDIAEEASAAGVNAFLPKPFFLSSFQRAVSQLLEGASDFPSACGQLIHDWMSAHQRVIFNGDGYSHEWEEEAARRGLANHRTTAEALPCYVDPKSIALFAEFGVLSEGEVRSRYEVKLEKYNKIMNIECRVMKRLVRRDYLPAINRYAAKLANGIAAIRGVLPDGDTSFMEDKLRRLVAGAAEINRQLEKLNELHHASREVPDQQERANMNAHEIVPVMDALREAVDAMEIIVEREAWPVPTYNEILFYA